MMEFKGTLTKEVLGPIIRATRPSSSRLVDAIIGSFSLIILLSMAYALLILAGATFEFMQRYDTASLPAQTVILNLLTEQGLLWRLIFVVFIGIPAFGYISYLTFRSFHSVFDDRYIVSKQFKKITKVAGREFEFSISMNQVTVRDAAEEKVYDLTDFSKTTWLDDSVILHLASKREFLFLILSDHSAKSLMREIREELAIIDDKPTTKEH